jgi:hypothetical protein
MMIKIKFTSHGITEFYNYLEICKAANFNEPSRTFFELLKFHAVEIQQELQKKYLQMMHAGRAHVSIKISLPQRLCLSYLFKHIPVGHFLVPIEFKILEGL